MSSSWRERFVGDFKVVLYFLHNNFINRCGEHSKPAGNQPVWTFEPHSWRRSGSVLASNQRALRLEPAYRRKTFFAHWQELGKAVMTAAPIRRHSSGMFTNTSNTGTRSDSLNELLYSFVRCGKTAAQSQLI